MSSHWLRHYGNLNEYRWRKRKIKDALSQEAFTRPLGLVEARFDADGRYYVGRADISSLLEVCITEHIARDTLGLAWALLRCQHLLMGARTFLEDDGFATRGLHWAVDVHGSVEEAVQEARKHMVFVEDHYAGDVETWDYYRHAMNTGRVIEPDEALAKVFVLPVEKNPADRKMILRFLFVFAHSIADGLSAYVWMRDLVQNLNEPKHILRQKLEESMKSESISSRLPLPQEALYPRIPGSLARQRWFWAIVRVLRHVRKPLAIGFANPLLRSQPRPEAISLSPTYPHVLDYTSSTLLNTYPTHLRISTQSTARLSNICKSVHASLGAGIYALTALVAMEFHEARYPNIPLHERKSFITAFPLNPRAFFNHTTTPDSMMLAFSDGIALPFLSSHLDLEGRLRLLARQAQRQLSTYQKRAKPKGHDATKQFLTSRGAGLVLANQYLLSLEMKDTNVPEHLREPVDVQGAYPARMNPTMQTHGVSSTGRKEAMAQGGSDSVTVHKLTMSVRPRDGEFLVGIGGSDEGLGCTPSLDANALDPERVEIWRQRFETALDQVEEESSSSSSSSRSKL